MNKKRPFLVVLALITLTLACQAPKEEAEYTSREPIPTSTANDVAITITEERFQAPAEVIEGAPGLPVAVKEWNTPEMLRYEIGPGDILHIAIYYSVESLAMDIEVQSDGKMTLPLIGPVEVVGKTPQEVQTDLQEKFAVYYVSPSVQVGINTYKAHQIYVMGWGVKNLQIPLKKRSTVFEILNQIGGDITLVDVDLRGAYLQRGLQIFPIDFRKLLDGDFSNNYEVKDNDILHMRSLKTMKIFILGEVARQGVYNLEVDDNLFWAIARAGGINMRSQTHEIRIIRGGLSNPILLTVDISPMYRRKTPRMFNTDDLQKLRVSADSSRKSTMALEKLYLRDGDFIFVPRTALAHWNDIMTQISPTLSFIYSTPMSIARDTVYLGNALQ